MTNRPGGECDPCPARTLLHMSRPQIERVTSPRQALKLLASLVGTSMLAGLLTAGLFMPVVGAAGQATRVGLGFFEALPVNVPSTQMSQQSRILWSDGTPMATFYYQNRVLVPLDRVAPVMREAIVAVEDYRFYDHNGADPVGIGRAMVSNSLGNDEQGASTLTQQWVKNVLLDEALTNNDEAQIRALQTPDKGRKIREIKLAVAAERKYSKDQILENYLNIALFGDGQYGVQTASRRFLSKDASELTLPDAALLAGVVRSPTFYDPTDHPDRAQSRRDVVLDRMLELGIITGEEHDAAVAVPITDQLRFEETTNGCRYADRDAGFFCDYVTKVILNDPAFGPDRTTRQRLLYRGGLTITTTLDPDRQQAAQRAVDTYLNNTDSVGGAISSVDSTSGHIVAMAQNKIFAPQADEQVEGGGALNYNVDQAHGGGLGFQPGSTYKAFTLATWLAKGHGLNETVNANQRRYNVARFKARCDDGSLGGTYAPRNSEGQGRGRMSVLAATESSVNTAYMSMAYELDLCDIRDTAAMLGVRTGDGEPLPYNPATVLGAREVTPLSMAGAFGGFANNGTYCQPVAILSVTDSAGTPLPKPEANCQQVLEPQVAAQVSYALNDAYTSGTGKRIPGIGRPAAGKTGTTNNSTETWFVGYTPQGLSTAAWVGTPNNRPKSLNGARFGGRGHGRVYGATVAGPMWARYMGPAVSGMPVGSFQAVGPRVRRDEQVTVPRVVGRSEDQARDLLEDQGLEVGATVETDGASEQGTIIGTSPRSGSRVTGGTEVRILVSNGKG